MKCETCSGKGKILDGIMTDFGLIYSHLIKCPTCKGTGKIKSTRPAPNKSAIQCMYCGGPVACKVCGITCWEAGGLTDEGLCAGCAVRNKKCQS